MTRPFARACIALLSVVLIGMVATTGFAAARRPPPHASSPAAPNAADPDFDPAPIAVLAAAVDRAENELDGISLHARTIGISDTDLRSRIAEIAPIQGRLAQTLDDLNPRLKIADARLEQLGPPPGAGETPEDPEITRNRQEILRYRESVDTEVKQARLLTTEAVQLDASLTDRRRELFSQRLTIRTRSVLDPKLWTGFAAGLSLPIGRLETILAGEERQVASRAGPAPTTAIWSLAALLAVVLLGPARLWLNRWAEARLAQRLSGARAAHALIAAWWVFVAVAAPLLAGVVVQAALTGTNASTPAFGGLLSLLWKTIVFGALIEGLARALLASRRPDWRLAPVSEALVARLAPFPTLFGLTAALTGFLAGLNSLLGSSGDTTEATACLTLLLELVVFGSALGRIGRARLAAENLPAADGQGVAPSRLPWIVAAVAAWLAMSVALIAIMWGYVAFATFLVREMVWAAAVLAALFILLRSVDALAVRLLSPNRTLGRAFRGSIGVSSQGLEQIVEIVSGVARLGLLLAGWVAVVAPFGADAQDVFGRVTSTSLVLHLGQVAISPGAIAGALLVLGLTLVAAHTLRSWLESRYLPKTRMDVGVRASLASGVTYAGALVALLLTCAYLGLSLDRIALFASALSVGIGFGLQAVIGNFVSGLILLAERPVRVGDWIAIGDMEGDIRRINVRATEIEMRDRSRLIVPNSELVSKTVRNVTHGASLGRVKIVLALDDHSDPLLVRELLMKRLCAHPEALADPPASVYMTDIKNGTLEITAFVYVASPRSAFAAKSDLLFQILPDLKAQGIALATSNPVVHVDVADRPIEPGLKSI